MGRFRLEDGRNSALHRGLCPEAARGTARGHTQEDNVQEEDKGGHQASFRREIRVPDGDGDQEEAIEDVDPQSGYGQSRSLPSQEDGEDLTEVLDEIIAALAPDTATACEELDNFITDVTELVENGELADGSSLIDPAEAIKISLGCPA